MLDALRKLTVEESKNRRGVIPARPWVIDLFCFDNFSVREFHAKAYRPYNVGDVRMSQGSKLD